MTINSNDVCGMYFCWTWMHMLKRPSKLSKKKKYNFMSGCQNVTPFKNKNVSVFSFLIVLSSPKSDYAAGSDGGGMRV
jgi:hypothetical protein